VKRFVVALLIALVAVPWSAVPAAKGSGCPMSKAAMTAMRSAAVAPARTSCAYCVPASTASAPSANVPSLGVGCCRFLPKAESLPAQAGSLGVPPKPLQSPDGAAALASPELSAIPAASVSRSCDRIGASPPHAPPTRTTHLLL
jgi:hypothetical protein